VRGAATGFLLIFANLAWAQADSMDTYDRLYALRDSLQAWSHHPPPDTVTAPDSVRFANYFVDANFSSVSDTSFTLIFPDYMKMHWGGLLGTADASGVEWTVLEDHLPERAAARLAWLRTLPLPQDFRAMAPSSQPYTMLMVLHGRDIDRIPMLTDNATSVLAWMARGRQMMAASLSSRFYVDNSASVDATSFELFSLITTPGSQGHHVFRWQESPDSIILHLYPFIPTGNIATVIAIPDSSRAGYDPIPVGPGVKREEREE